MLHVLVVQDNIDLLLEIEEHQILIDDVLLFLDQINLVLREDLLNLNMIVNNGDKFVS